MKRVLLSLLMITFGVQIMYAIPEALEDLRMRLAEPEFNALSEEDIQVLQMDGSPAPFQRYARLIASGQVATEEVRPLLDDYTNLAAAVAAEEEVVQDEHLREWVGPAQGLSRIAARKLAASVPELRTQLITTAQALSRSVENLRTQHRFESFQDEALKPAAKTFMAADDAATALVGETRNEVGWAAGAMAAVSGLAVFGRRFHRSMRQARDAGQMVEEGSKFFGLETVALAGSLKAGSAAAAAFLKPAAVVALGGYIMLKIRWAFTAEDKMKRMGLEQAFNDKLRKVQKQIDELQKKLGATDRETKAREKKMQLDLQDALKHEAKQARANAVESLAIATKLNGDVRLALQDLLAEHTAQKQQHADALGEQKRQHEAALSEQQKQLAAALLMFNRCMERQQVTEEIQRAMQPLLHQIASHLGLTNHRSLMEKLLHRKTRSAGALPHAGGASDASVLGGDVIGLQEPLQPTGINTEGVGPRGLQGAAAGE